MARLPTHLEELFRKDGIWWDFFKMSQHLDSPLEIDFTDLRIKNSIQCPSPDIVVYVLRCNSVSDQSVEGLLAKNRGNLRRDCPVKPRPLIIMATTASRWNMFHSSDIPGTRFSTGLAISGSLHIPATRRGNHDPGVVLNRRHKTLSCYWLIG